MTNRALDLLAVFAHPDDETFRPGGTLALLALSGVHVHLLTATRGQAGASGNPPLCTPEDLPAMRERELRCACATLGIQPPRLLDYEDGKLSEAEPDRVIAQILESIHEIQPQVLLTFGPDGLSGHPDHIAIGQWTSESFRRCTEIAALYTVAVPQSLARTLDMRQVHPVPDETIAFTVDVSPVWEIKLAAIRCHATQMSSSPMMRAPAERQRLFFGREYFVRAALRHIAGDFLPDTLKGYIQ
jgi:LmbE family N-acetylglucosaminyl deacetylase